MPGTDQPPGREEPPEPRPVERICVLLDHDANRRILADWLGDFDRYGIAEDASALDESVDLCLVDSPGLDANRSELSDWKTADEDVFTPCLLASERSGRAVPESDETLVDDVVELPIGRAALDRRLRRLLMQREQSLELDAARRILDEQNERLRTFAGRLAHDLRNPLGIVTGYVGEVRESHPNDEEYFEAIDSGLARMQRLVDETLTLAKMGQTAIDREPMSLRTVAERAWGHVEADGAILTVTGDARLEADETRLEALFENLYRNAVEHGSTGPRSQAHQDAVEHAGSDVAVEVGLLPTGFYVADDGPGIHESDREQVFEVGYTTNEDGTGFGLRIVREIVDAHGWTVTIVESENGGARFEVDGCDFLTREDTN